MTQQTPATSTAIKACPVFDQAETVVGDARQLNPSMRKLRSAMKQCASCARNNCCPALEEFSRRLTAILQEIYEQWGLF